MIRANPARVEEALNHRNMPGALDNFLQLDEQRRSLLTKVEELKSFRNRSSQEVGKMKKQGQDPAELMEKVRQVGQEITVLDEQVNALEKDLEKILLNIPNIPHESVPVGKDEQSNKEIRRWGEPRRFAFEPLAHWDIGPNLDILDFERAAKLSGARFAVYKGWGAKLERAVINFYLDVHTNQHGYREILPPFMVTADCMLGTGQLPNLLKTCSK
jgi:seryl-tRNA synthetase